MSRWAISNRRANCLAELPAGSERRSGIWRRRARRSRSRTGEPVGELGELEARLGAEPNDHQARYDLADGAQWPGRREEAADALLDIIRRDRQWNEDGARKQLLQFFEAWGDDAAETVAARRKLSALVLLIIRNKAGA